MRSSSRRRAVPAPPPLPSVVRVTIELPAALVTRELGGSVCRHELANYFRELLLDSLFIDPAAHPLPVTVG